MAAFWRLVNRVSRALGVHPPPGPAGGIWSWKYLDKIKTARMVRSKRVMDTYRAFPDLLPPGSQFPQITGDTTDGVPVDTRSFLHQKHFVLITGAIT